MERRTAVDSGDQVIPSGSNFTPTNVPADTTWEIGKDMQAVGFVRIRLDGTLIVNGTLVML